MKASLNTGESVNDGARPGSQRYLDQKATKGRLNDRGIDATDRQVKRLFSAEGFPRIKVGRKTYVREDRLDSYIDNLRAD